MQLRGMLVIDRDLWGTQSLDQTTDEVENLGLVIGFY